MTSRSATVTNPLGMHARAAARFARAASAYRSRITVARQSHAVDGKSIMGLLLLTAPRGAMLTIAAEGDDEQHAVDALCDLVERGFGEDSSTEHS